MIKSITKAESSMARTTNMYSTTGKLITSLPWNMIILSYSYNLFFKVEKLSRHLCSKIQLFLEISILNKSQH